MRIETVGRDATIAAAVAFLVFLANGRIVSDGDSVASRYVPLSIWAAGTTSLEPFETLATEVPPGKPYTVPYWTLRRPSGRLVSFYPLVTPVLVAPLYAPAAALLSSHGWELRKVRAVALVMEKLVAALVAALAVGLVLLLVRRRLDRGRAFLLTAAFAFGTSTFSVSAQALWQHGTAELLLAAALLAATGAGRRRELFACGIACGLLAVCRPPDALFSVAILAALLLRHRAGALVALAAAAAAASPFLFQNLRDFGHLAGGYGAIGLAGRHPFYGHPLGLGIAGLLVSPARGLLVFSPFLLFLFARRFREGDRLDPFLLAAIALQITLYAKADWRAGSCYGPRFLSDILPALVFLMVPVVARLQARGLALLGAAATLSAAIHAVGAFCYPRGASDARYYPPGVSRREIPGAVFSPRLWQPLLEVRAGAAPPELPSAWRAGFR